MDESNTFYLNLFYERRNEMGLSEMNDFSH
jgi:hypothetical protein